MRDFYAPPGPCARAFRHRFAGFTRARRVVHNGPPRLQGRAVFPQVRRPAWGQLGPQITRGGARTPTPRRAARTARACRTARGSSPWTHTESTPAASSTARRAISSVVEDRTRLRARHQPPPGCRRGRGSPRASPRDPAPPPSPARRAGQPQRGQRARPQHRLRLLEVVHHPVVEGAVRLDVAHLALLHRDPAQQADLLRDVLPQHPR